MQIEEEHTAGVRRVGGPHDRRLPVKQVISNLHSEATKNRTKTMEVTTASETATRKYIASVELSVTSPRKLCAQCHMLDALG